MVGKSLRVAFRDTKTCRVPGQLGLLRLCARDRHAAEALEPLVRRRHPDGYRDLYMLLWMEPWRLSRHAE
ncbi:hypothetical protein F6B41_27570 [Microbacterium lushaniae]|nr:hypothetical protein F6B41_27570 [Microbacterium lushaniae]